MANISEINGYLINAESASYAANGGVTQLLAGPNVTLSPTNGKGQVTVSATLSGSTIFNTATGSYGSFYDTTTQTNPVGNVPRSMSFDSTDITNGVSISGSTNPFNTYIKTENAGIYNIQFSAQVDKTDSGADEIVIWLRKNGIDLTDTATTLTLSGNNDKKVAAWNWFVTSAANDYYQIIWLSADTDLRLLAEPISGTHPGIPSVILTANRVDQFLSNTGSFSGSFNGSFTGSLFGTASWATNALTASFINTASTNAFVQNGNSFGITALLGTNDNQSLAFETSGSTRMFISSSGNVGIGTTSSAYNLEVVGSNTNTARFYGNSGTAVVGIGVNGTLQSSGGQFRLYGNSSVPLTLGSYGVWGDLWIINGNVGIGQGTTAPTLSSRFTIKGSGATSATTALRVENTNVSASLVVRDDGSVGIGTNTPISRLSVVDNNGYSPSLNATASANFNVSRGTTGATNLVFTLSGSSPFTAAIQHRHAAIDGISYAISLNPLGGNVGIGTNSPAYTLDVSGDARATNLYTGIIYARSSALQYISAGGSSLNQHLFTVTSNQNPTSGDTFLGNFSSTFNPTSGTATYANIRLVPTINQTGGANGITRGIYVNPTLTAAADFRAIETTSGSILFQNGSVTSTSGFTGSLQGTASWATNALTASYALSSPSTTVYVAHGNGTTAANSLSYTCYLGGTPVSITTATNAFGSAANQFMPGYPMAAAGTASGLIINLRTTGSAASAYKYYVSNFNTSTTGSVITMAAGHAAGVYSGSIGQVTFNQGDALFFMISSTFVAGASASAQLTTSTFKYTTN